MIIRSAHVNGFGLWADQDFNFDDRLQVFFGYNEAGKSTLRAFVRGVLFGFIDSEDRTINNYEPDSGAPYGGYLDVVVDNREYRIKRTGRRESRLDILDWATQTQINNPDLWLDSLLSPVDGKLFDQVFNFDQQQLNEISSLTRQGLADRLLRVGASGSDVWYSVSRVYEKSANEKFNPDAKIRPLNTLISEYRKIEDQIQNSNKELSRFQLMHDNDHKFELEVADWNLKIQGLQPRLKELADLRQAEPIINQINNLEQQSQSQANANPALFEENDRKIIELNAQIQTLNEQINQSKNSFNQEATNSNSANIADNTELKIYLNNESNLNELRVELPNINNQLSNYNQLASRRDALKTNHDTLRAKYGSDVPKPLDIDTQYELKNKKSRNPRWMIFANAIFGLVALAAYVLYFNPNDNRKFMVGFLGIVFIGVAIATAILHVHDSRSNILLGKFGYKDSDNINSVLSDQPAIQAYHQNINQLNELNNQIGAVVSDLNSKIKLFQPLRTYLSQDIKVENIEGIIPEVNRFFGQVDVQKNDNVEVIVQEQALDQLFSQEKRNLEMRRKELYDQLDIIFASLGVTSYEGYLEYKNNLVQNRSINEQIMTLRSKISDDQINEFHLHGGIAGVDSEIVEIRNEQEKMERLRDIATQKLADGRSKIAQLSNDVSYQNLLQDKADLQAKIISQFESYLLDALTAEWIEATLSMIASERFPKIVQMAKNFFRSLTDGEYVDIFFNRETIIVENKSGARYNAVQLSKGTAEQLYVAFRFSFAEMISEIIEIPILIDDSFVNFDQLRRRNTFELLRTLSDRHQVIYFTANQSDADSLPNVFDLSNIRGEIY